MYPAGPEPMMITLRTSLTGVFLVSADCWLSGPAWCCVRLTPPNGSYGAGIPRGDDSAREAVAERGQARGNVCWTRTVPGTEGEVVSQEAETT
ncbi:hypothetical protein GCM10010218_25480 [Streptomyces mashuensis]|uniref:Uncharacterized protein n=1 Tax=Streptomyces mashuensis TaxID=33904 RepID=A0A919B3M7_9ACTN|nr:hypothetical protein GCM10010218_25480 [Streptomyces mashuensis]